MIAINGHNISTMWQLELVKDGFYNELMKFADLKDRLYNDWSDRNGIDVNLTAPLYKQRELTLQFFCNSYANYKLFINFVKANQILSLYDSLTDLIYTVEYLDCSNFNYYRDYNLFAIKVRENNPAYQLVPYLLTETGIYLYTETGLKIHL